MSQNPKYCFRSRLCFLLLILPALCHCNCISIAFSDFPTDFNNSALMSHARLRRSLSWDHMHITASAAEYSTPVTPRTPAEGMSRPDDDDGANQQRFDRLFPIFAAPLHVVYGAQGLNVGSDAQDTFRSLLSGTQSNRSDSSARSDFIDVNSAPLDRRRHRTPRHHGRHETMDATHVPHRQHTISSPILPAIGPIGGGMMTSSLHSSAPPQLDATTPIRQDARPVHTPLHLPDIASHESRTPREHAVTDASTLHAMGDLRVTALAQLGSRASSPIQLQPASPDQARMHACMHVIADDALTCPSCRSRGTRRC